MNQVEFVLASILQDIQRIEFVKTTFEDSWERRVLTTSSHMAKLCHFVASRLEGERRNAVEGLRLAEADLHLAAEEENEHAAWTKFLSALRRAREVFDTSLATLEIN